MDRAGKDVARVELGAPELNPARQPERPAPRSLRVYDGSARSNEPRSRDMKGAKEADRTSEESGSPPTSTTWTALETTLAVQRGDQGDSQALVEALLQ